ncbi:hypothetical protein B7494_g343 [Chlorociboria aeruginascens]|nr:hypothetical protein B7494_g343 [Chlorociboria aeruginascens]
MSSKTSYALSSTLSLPIPLPTSTSKSPSPIHIPLIHLGVYLTSGYTTTSSVTSALQIGYRAFDSAEWYANEAEVGDAINKFLATSSKLERKDIWFTTKLKTNYSYDATRKSIRESVKKSGLGYLDLYLLHSPYGGRQKRRECWRAVVDAVESGEVRVGGLQELLTSFPKHPPTINQIEIHPFNTQSSITKFCKENNIAIEAYAPLARSLRFSHPKIKELSKKYGCTPAQLMIRWSLQHGYITLPKSVKEKRIRENADIGRFEISDEDMGVMDGLDEKLVTDWDPTDAD